MQRILALILLAATFVACGKEMLPPERPAGVPELATWGGGADGGSWFHCRRKQESYSYACSIYWDTDGSLRANGTYVLKQVTWAEDQNKAVHSDVESYPEIVFDFFDGVIIHLQGENALLPHGIIDHPFGGGHGKKQRYDMDNPQGPEEEY